jgi:dihydrofolate reductase
MGQIVVSENVTLDGVFQDPTGDSIDDGFKLGGWFEEISNSDRAAWAQIEFDEALASSAMLLGRRSYQWFAERWATRPGEWADRLRSLPKYVVSSDFSDLTWHNTTVVSVDEVATLKQRVEGDIVVYASGRLVHTLVEHDLVDELRLLIHPFILGTGERVFTETGDLQRLRLVKSQTVGANLMQVIYRKAVASSIEAA